MSLDHIKSAIKDKMSYAASIKGRFKFDFGDDGVLVVDSTETPPTMIEEDVDDADVVLSTSLETFEGIMNGTKDPNMAFMTGKLKIKGSIGLAMKLNSILED